ncbi:MAG: hypothetical protein MUO62_15225, partial [Anaerolineales bacterium]|nr:hypothetical protein [Anaerolineales bacterium]
MDLNKERTMVLEMIAEGKITVDEGEELIKALNASARKGGQVEPRWNEIPAVPAMPAIPSIPSLPAIPALPAIPSMGRVPPMPPMGRGIDSYTDLAAELRAAGITKLTVSDLQELVDHRVTPAYVREMIALGLAP